MRTWLTQNRWYLVACAVLVPAALVTASTVSLAPYLQYESGDRVAVAPFESAVYGGATYTLLEHHSFDWTTEAGERAGLLEGSELVTATVSVTPGDGEFTGCEFTLFDHDRERQWDPSSTADADFETDVPDYCLSDAVDPYRVQVFFVVPVGAAGGAFLELSHFTLLPRSLSFAL